MEVPTVTFQQLLYVVEISRCGSINKAAQNLFLSQSSISSAIKELETELGIRFFNRTNRGVEFTQAGREFLSYATTLLDQKRHIENIYKASKHDSPLHFSVSTQRYPFAEDAFIRLLRKIDASQIYFKIKETGMDVVIEDVNKRQADIGVIFLSNMNEKIIRRVLKSKNIELHEIAVIRPCAFVRRGHPLTKKATVSPDDLSQYTYLAFESDLGVSPEFSEEINLLSFQRPPRVVTVNDRAAAIGIISSTDAVTTGSGLLMDGLVDERAVSIPLETEDRMQLIWIKSRSSKLSREGHLFLEYLKQAVEDSLAYTEKIRRQLREEAAAESPATPPAAEIAAEKEEES